VANNVSSSKNNFSESNFSISKNLPDSSVSSLSPSYTISKELGIVADKNESEFKSSSLPWIGASYGTSSNPMWGGQSKRPSFYDLPAKEDFYKPFSSDWDLGFQFPKYRDQLDDKLDFS
jgi:hypothetical protein